MPKRGNEVSAAEAESIAVRGSVLRMTEPQRWARWVELRGEIERQGGFLLDAQTLELTLLAQLLDGTTTIIDGQKVTAKVWFTYERRPLWGTPEEKPARAQGVQQPANAPASPVRNSKDQSWRARPNRPTAPDRQPTPQPLQSQGELLSGR